MYIINNLIFDEMTKISHFFGHTFIIWVFKLLRNTYCVKEYHLQRVSPTIDMHLVLPILCVLCECIFWTIF